MKQRKQGHRTLNFCPDSKLFSTILPYGTPVLKCRKKTGFLGFLIGINSVKNVYLFGYRPAMFNLFINVQIQPG